MRQDALQMLHNAIEGSAGSSASSAYSETFRVIMRHGLGDKMFVVRLVAAKCLKTFANIGGPGLGTSELENAASYCVKVCVCSFVNLIFKHDVYFDAVFRSARLLRILFHLLEMHLQKLWVP